MALDEREYYREAMRRRLGFSPDSWQPAPRHRQPAPKPAAPPEAPQLAPLLRQVIAETEAATRPSRVLIAAVLAIAAVPWLWLILTW
jgi:hypothetical protein